MPHLSKPLFTAGLLLALLAPWQPSRADEYCGASGGGCGGGCAKSRMCGRHAQFVPSVTFYAPYPYWWPNYFGPPYTSYQLCQYWTPPAESARIVKERILAINAANPAMLPPEKEPLPFPKPDEKEPETK
jgi:hypothetical protein